LSALFFLRFKSSRQPHINELHRKSPPFFRRNRKRFQFLLQASTYVKGLEQLEVPDSRDGSACADAAEMGLPPEENDLPGESMTGDPELG
jgi:hypothetical protein